MGLCRLTTCMYAAMAVLLAGATAVDLTAELNSGWAMGLRPRQEAQNLQAFSGAVGGVSASAVCFYHGSLKAMMAGRNESWKMDIDARLDHGVGGRGKAVRRRRRHLCTSKSMGERNKAMEESGGMRGVLTRGMQPDFQSAADRSCDNQKNNCADLANNGGGSFEVGDCDKQNGAFYPPHPPPPCPPARGHTAVKGGGRADCFRGRRGVQGTQGWGHGDELRGGGAGACELRRAV